MKGSQRLSEPLSVKNQNRQKFLQSRPRNNLFKEMKEKQINWLLLRTTLQNKEKGYSKMHKTETTSRYLNRNTSHSLCPKLY